eukprot:10419.XXX_491953_493614_1 [CDS] Oithona nana genome sequencing.
MFWRQFVRYKSSSISLEKLSEEVRSEIGKIRTRIQIIGSESECKAITDKLNEHEKPIAVDLEAVQKSPGLVQVADFQDNIYLFRTGINRNLFQNGGLKSLLQNPNVTKVMHAATIDCLSLHKAGIYLDPLFDTSVAHAVIQFQDHGLPYWSQIGFNNICERYGFPPNPFKDSYSGYYWTHLEKHFFKKETLPEDMIIYCAYDVVPLLDLQRILKDSIQLDFQHLLHDLTQDMILRPIDERLVKHKNKLRRKERDKQLFFQTSKNKGEIYDMIKDFDGDKSVLKGAKSAVITLDSRQDILDFQQSLQKSGISEAKLLREIENEVETKYESLGKQVLDTLITMPSIPVYLQFALTENVASVELNFLDKSIKLDLDTQENVELFGTLMNCSSLPKIIPRLTVSPVIEAFKLLDQNKEIANIFDIDSAVKICDFFNHGKPILKSTSMKIKDICDKYGIDNSTKKTETFDVYFHLVKIMPEEALIAFNDLMTLHIKTATLSKSEIKDVKSYFTSKHEVIKDTIEKAVQDVKVDKQWLDEQKRIYQDNLIRCGISDLIK